jgi:hypothetical protein
VAIEAILVERGAACLVLGRELHKELSVEGITHNMIRKGNFIIVNTDKFHYHANEEYGELKVYDRNFTIRLLTRLRDRLRNEYEFGDNPLLVINQFLLEYIERLLKRL